MNCCWIPSFLLVWNANWASESWKHLLHECNCAMFAQCPGTKGFTCKVWQFFSSILVNLILIMYWIFFNMLLLYWKLYFFRPLFKKQINLVAFLCIRYNTLGSPTDSAHSITAALRDLYKIMDKTPDSLPPIIFLQVWAIFLYQQVAQLVG